MTVISVQEKLTGIKGRVIAPKDPEYDAARQVFYGGIDERPSLIVRVADDEDVRRVVTLARDSSLELAVRCGGHSVVGHSTSEGGIVLDLSKMKRIDVDVANGTVWAEGGLTAVEVTTALSEHGKAVGFGDTGSVGIGGITTGGGIGLLARKFGMTIDSLLAADVVTADGEVVRASADSHPDLFWAIRGGGGNFGAVTRFEYRLADVPEAYGWMLIQPATADTIGAFIAEADRAPEGLTTIANVMQCPPLPFVAPEHHGKTVNFAFVVYAGDAKSAERAIAPIRAIAPAISDMLKPMKLPELYPPAEGEYKPLAASRTRLIDSVDRALARTIVDRATEHQRSSGAQMAGAQLRVLGGALSRVPAEATAYAHRSSKILVNTFSLYAKPEEAPVHEAFIESFTKEFEQGPDRAYVNFLGEDGARRIRAAYPGATYDRLARIKARYDPSNFFRLNQNIAPAKAS